MDVKLGCVGGVRHTAFSSTAIKSFGQPAASVFRSYGHRAPSFWRSRFRSFEDWQASVRHRWHPGSRSGDPGCAYPELERSKASSPTAMPVRFAQVLRFSLLQGSSVNQQLACSLPGFQEKSGRTRREGPFSSPISSRHPCCPSDNPTGPHGTKPMPSSSQASRTPFRSGLLSMSEYSL